MPLGQCGRAAVLVGLAIDEVAFLVEVVVEALSEQMHRAQIEPNLNGRRVFEVAEIPDSAKPHLVHKALK